MTKSRGHAHILPPTKTVALATGSREAPVKMNDITSLALNYKLILVTETQRINNVLYQNTRYLTIKIPSCAVGLMVQNTMHYFF